MFNRRIDEFTKLDNQISNLNKNKLEYVREIKKIDNEILFRKRKKREFT